MYIVRWHYLVNPSAQGITLTSNEVMLVLDCNEVDIGVSHSHGGVGY